MLLSLCLSSIAVNCWLEVCSFIQYDISFSIFSFWQKKFHWTRVRMLLLRRRWKAICVLYPVISWTLFVAWSAVKTVVNNRCNWLIHCETNLQFKCLHFFHHQFASYKRVVRSLRNHRKKEVDHSVVDFPEMLHNSWYFYQIQAKLCLFRRQKFFLHYLVVERMVSNRTHWADFDHCLNFQSTVLTSYDATGIKP